MKYLPLLKLDIRHSYYADGRCPNFYIEASRRTQKILQGHRCISRNTPSGFMLLQAVSNDAAFIELPQSTILRFRIHPVNTTYRLFTDFSKFPEQGSAIFTNKGISGNELRITAAETVREDQYFADIEIEINDTVKPVEKNPMYYQINCIAKQAYWEFFLYAVMTEAIPSFSLFMRKIRWVFLLKKNDNIYPRNTSGPDDYRLDLQRVSFCEYYVFCIQGTCPVSADSPEKYSTAAE
jgi:hypothetical protein